MDSVFDDLMWRGLMPLMTDPEALRAALETESVRFYVGFDPTAPSLHMGNLLQLVTARRLQDAGHRPILVVGGSTGLIGDPRMKSERNLNPVETVEKWVELIRAQIGDRYVSFDGDAAAIIVNNYDWTKDMYVLDYLRDIGKYFSVSRMIARDVVKNRLDSGISYAEFSYVLLQSLDYLELFRRYGCTLQIGGSDQWGNITAGVELIRRVEGARVHAFTTPLITKADGTKYGKTESGAVWLDTAMTSPYGFHQFFLNVEDAKVVEFVKAFTRRCHEEVEELERQTKESPHLRVAQRVLADDLTDLVHSVAERQAATKAAEAIFGRADLHEVDAATLRGVAVELKAAHRAGLDGYTVVDALVDSSVVASRGAAKRAIAEGGAYIDNIRVDSVDAAVRPTDVLPGGCIVVRRGKKTVGMVVIDGPETVATAS